VELEEAMKTLVSMLGVKVETPLYRIDSLGAELIRWTCQNCGREVIGDWAICPHCRAKRPLPPELTKRKKRKRRS